MGEKKHITLGGYDVDVTQVEIVKRQAGHPAIQRDQDFCGWLLDQASALREMRAVSLDWANLAEELEAMAAVDRRELLRRLTTLFAHLFKLQCQAERAPRSGRGWRLTATRSRIEIRRLLEQSPSLKGQLEEFARDAYADARREAGTAMGMRRVEWQARFPEACPWSLDQAFDPDFFRP